MYIRIEQEAQEAPSTRGINENEDAQAKIGLCSRQDSFHMGLGFLAEIAVLRIFSLNKWPGPHEEVLLRCAWPQQVQPWSRTALPPSAEPHIQWWVRANR